MPRLIDADELIKDIRSDNVYVGYNYPKNTDVSDIHEIINSQETVYLPIPTWHKIESVEDLPGRDVTVDVICKGKVDIARLDEYGMWYGMTTGNLWVCDKTCNPGSPYELKVTHWRPRPEPPMG